MIEQLLFVMPEHLIQIRIDRMVKIRIKYKLVIYRIVDVVGSKTLILNFRNRRRNVYYFVYKFLIYIVNKCLFY